jgi:RNA polymerase sigma-32 factor
MKTQVSAKPQQHAKHTYNRSDQSEPDPPEPDPPKPSKPSKPDTDGTERATDDLVALGEGAFAIPAGGIELSGDMSALDSYFARLNYVEPLSADDQRELAVRYLEENDTEAAKLLVLTNLRLVVKLALEYRRHGTNLLELIQEGNVGLAEAVKRYDPYRGVKFISYAQYWIRAMMFNHMMSHIHPVKICGTRAGRKLFFNLNKARRAIRAKGLEPTTERVAEYLEVDEQDVELIGMNMKNAPVSLDMPLREGSATTVSDMMETDEPSPEDNAAQHQFRVRLREAIDHFGKDLNDERRESIWFQRTLSHEPHSLRELGEVWNVSKERIRQIEVEIRDEFKIYFTEYLGGEAEVQSNY